MLAGLPCSVIPAAVSTVPRSKFKVFELVARVP
jgi:hypothetical protein